MVKLFIRKALDESISHSLGHVRIFHDVLDNIGKPLLASGQFLHSHGCWWGSLGVILQINQPVVEDGRGH